MLTVRQAVSMQETIDINYKDSVTVVRFYKISFLKQLFMKIGFLSRLFSF